MCENERVCSSMDGDRHPKGGHRFVDRSSSSSSGKTATAIDSQKQQQQAEAAAALSGSSSSGPKRQRIARLKEGKCVQKREKRREAVRVCKSRVE